LWGLHLYFSLNIKTTGSHVPHKSLDQVCHLYAGRRPASKQAPSGLILELSEYPSFDAIPDISTPHRWFAVAHLLDPHLIPSNGTFFLNAHHTGSLPAQLKAV